jgi:hypothetical protein
VIIDNQYFEAVGGIGLPLQALEQGGQGAGFITGSNHYADERMGEGLAWWWSRKTFPAIHNGG